MKKITRRNFLIASGKTVGTLAAASAFMGCASPEQAENCFPRSAMPVRTDDRLTAIDNIVENYMGQGYFPGATIVVARGGKIVYEKAYGYAMLNDMGVRLDDPRPMQMDTMFDMASCTKIMATTQSMCYVRSCSYLLQNNDDFILFQHLAIGHHLTVHHQSGGGHHTIGGDLFKVPHMVNGRIHPKLPQCVYSCRFQRITLGTAAAKNFDPGLLLFSFCRLHCFRRTAPAAAARLLLFFFFLTKSEN